MENVLDEMILQMDDTSVCDASKGGFPSSTTSRQHRLEPMLHEEQATCLSEPHFRKESVLGMVLPHPGS